MVDLLFLVCNRPLQVLFLLLELGQLSCLLTQGLGMGVFEALKFLLFRTQLGKGFLQLLLQLLRYRLLRYRRLWWYF